MRRVQDILAEMKPLMGSLDTEERKRLNTLEEELKTLQMTAEDKTAAKEWYEEGLGEIKESIGHIEHELKIRDQLKEIADILGFEDQASFSRFFKNMTGQSAVQFRNTEVGKN